MEAITKLAAEEKTRFLWPVARGGVASPLRADGGLPRRAGEERRAQLDAKGCFCSPASFAIGSIVYFAFYVQRSALADGVRCA